MPLLGLAIRMLFIYGTYKLTFQCGKLAEALEQKQIRDSK